MQGRSDYESRRRHRHRASPIPTGPIWLRGPAPAALDSSEDDLRALLEHVRGGFTQLVSREIDEFELDALIHHSTRSAAELWKFCGASGGQWQQAANSPRYLREQGDGPDWRERGTPRRSRTP